MADTTAFFNDYLPNKIKGDSNLTSMGVVYQFDITGAGTWSLILKDGGSVVEGATPNADCVLTCAKDDWEKLLDNPASGMMLFMQGKLKASNIGLATKLQQILG